MTYDYEVLYLGTGHATYNGAIPLSSRGVKVGVIEEDTIGGTCPNWGCDAKIILDKPVVVKDQVDRMGNLFSGDIKVNWPESEKHKESIIGHNPELITNMMSEAGITVLKGHASFKDRHTVMVNGREVTGEKIVIATGQRPHKLEVSGSEFTHDSKDFLSLKEMPKRIAVLGGGYVALELATIAATAGAETTIIIRGSKILKQFHQPFVEEVVNKLKKMGVSIVKEANVDEIQKENHGYRIITQNVDIEADWILDATGRIPNTEDLNLNVVGVEYNSRGIVVDDHLRTTVDNIYAAGDVVEKNQPKLTPTAILETLYLTKLFTGDESGALKYPVIPTVVFTSPRIAQLGVSVEEAQQSPDLYEVKTFDLSNNWYRRIGKDDSAKSVIVKDKSGHIVGATEVSAEADNVINSLLPAVELQLDSEQLSRLIYLFPSIASSAQGLLG
ncbi:dihydrolipoyl dehydrogenase family protein [Furfurilactobacillus sp. WILCCON 0119]